MLNGYPLNGAPLNGSGDFDPVAGGARPLDLGPIRLVDLSLNRVIGPLGMDLVSHGFPVAELSPILPSDQFATAGGARPLELGGFALVPADTEATAGDAQPLELGPIVLGAAATAGDAEPLELGGPVALAYSGTAGGATPLEMGGLRIVVAVRLPGLDLVTWGRPIADMAGAEGEAGGATPLELGDLGQFGYAAVARGAMPLQLGGFTLTRGNAC